MATDSATRLDADIEALTRLASFFLNKTQAEIKALIGQNSANNTLLGHYQEMNNGVSTYTKSVMSADDFFHALTGNESESFDASQGYFFSDYAVQNQDGPKLWLNFNNGVVSGAG